MSDSLKILWLKSGPLYPLDTGGKIRTHAMLQEISKEHPVTYLAFRDLNEDLDTDEVSAPYAQEKIWIHWREAKTGTFRFFKELLLNLFSSLPYALEKYQSKTMQERIRQLDESGEFQLIVCDFLFPAPNFHPIFSKLKTRSVLFQHNIESEIWRRLRDTKSNPIFRLYLHLQYRRMFTWEKRLSRLFKGVITVSPNDSAFCRSQYELDNVVGEVQTGVDADYFSPADEAPSDDSHREPRIAFLGSMDWMPNIDCVQYFAARVLPLILEKLPGVRFVIIGRSPAPAVIALSEEHSAIELTGTVDDIRPHLQSCDLMVVPLRAGGGTRIKIFEAMAMGVPVVSTTIGAEGLPVTHEENIFVADSDEDLADACLRLLVNPGLAQKMASAGRQKVIQDHSWEAVSRSFLKLCRE